MKIQNQYIKTGKLNIILSAKELEYIKLEIGANNEHKNSALYYHFVINEFASNRAKIIFTIDSEMIPSLLTEIESFYQDKIILCKLHDKITILKNKENWKDCPKCGLKNICGLSVTEEWYCWNCGHIESP